MTGYRLLKFALAVIAVSACARRDSSGLGHESTSAEERQPPVVGAAAGAPGVASGQGGSSSSEADVNEAVLQARALVARMEDEEEKAKLGLEGRSKPNAEKFLGSFTEADVALATGAVSDPSREWRIASSGSRKSMLVALSYKRGEFGARPKALEPQLFVLERRGDKLGLAARGEVDVGNASCSNDGGDDADGDDRVPTFIVDPDPYMIAPERVAMGVRFTCFTTFPSGEGSETRLMLFEQVEARLRQVFDARVAHSNFDRPTGNETTGGAVISFGRDRHEGHFDLLVQRTSKTVGSDPEAIPATAREPSQRVESETYVWRGGRYVLAEGR
jgi:hypothetical protein